VACSAKNLGKKKTKKKNKGHFRSGDKVPKRSNRNPIPLIMPHREKVKKGSTEKQMARGEGRTLFSAILEGKKTLGEGS